MHRTVCCLLGVVLAASLSAARVFPADAKNMKLALELYEGERYTESLKLLKNERLDDPDDYRIALLMGLNYEKLKQTDACVTMLEDAYNHLIFRSDLNEKEKEHLAQINALLDTHSDKRSDSKKAREKFVDDLLKAAKKHNKERHYAAAHDCLQEILRFYPEHEEARQLMAETKTAFEASQKLGGRIPLLDGKTTKGWKESAAGKWAYKDNYLQSEFSGGFAESSPELEWQTKPPSSFDLLVDLVTPKFVDIGNRPATIAVVINSKNKDYPRLEIQVQELLVGLYSADVKKIFKDYDKLDSGIMKTSAGEALSLRIVVANTFIACYSGKNKLFKFELNQPLKDAQLSILSRGDGGFSQIAIKQYQE